MSVVICYDAISCNISHLPRGQQAAGYATGSSIVAWTAADWAAHPGAVRIDQDVSAAVRTADVLDVERGAATPAEAPAWAKGALASYHQAARPGQRSPVVYANLSTMTSVVNALTRAKVTGIGLWIAHWGTSESADAAEINAGHGPYPVIGVQYTDAGLYDISVVSRTWLDATSGAGAHPTLAEGATGPAVVAAQKRLNVWGAKLTCDGDFGAATFSAVRVFQARVKLATDGVIGATTWAALDRNPAPVTPAGSWAYPAPGGIGVAVNSSVSLSWHAVTPPAGKPVPANYTVRLYRGTVISQTLTATRTSIAIGGLSAGPHTALIWANGAPGSGPHATINFTV